MTMIGTCRHEVTLKDLDFNSPMIAYDKKGDKCIEYHILCSTCREYLAKEIKKGKRLEKKLGFDKRG